MEEAVAVRHSRAVQCLSSATRRAESRPSRIGPISFGVKQMGARNAGNPHVACDVEGAGDVVWVGTPGPHRRASPRPYLGEPGGESPPGHSTFSTKMDCPRNARFHPDSDRTADIAVCRKCAFLNELGNL